MPSKLMEVFSSQVDIEEEAGSEKEIRSCLIVSLLFHEASEVAHAFNSSVRTEKKKEIGRCL